MSAVLSYYANDPVAGDTYNLPLAYFFVIPMGLVVTVLILVSRVVKDKERDASFEHVDVVSVAASEEIGTA